VEGDREKVEKVEKDSAISPPARINLYLGGMGIGPL
jgi:hypothetical protein